MREDLQNEYALISKLLMTKPDDIDLQLKFKVIELKIRKEKLRDELQEIDCDYELILAKINIIDFKLEFNENWIKNFRKIGEQEYVPCRILNSLL